MLLAAGAVLNVAAWMWIVSCSVLTMVGAYVASDVITSYNEVQESPSIANADAAAGGAQHKAHDWDAEDQKDCNGLIHAIVIA